jgi:hypothetical protein
VEQRRMPPRRRFAAQDYGGGLLSVELREGGGGSPSIRWRQMQLSPPRLELYGGSSAMAAHIPRRDRGRWRFLRPVRLPSPLSPSCLSLRRTSPSPATPKHGSVLLHLDPHQGCWRPAGAVPRRRLVSSSSSSSSTAAATRWRHPFLSSRGLRGGARRRPVVALFLSLPTGVNCQREDEGRGVRAAGEPLVLGVNSLLSL